MKTTKPNPKHYYPNKVGIHRIGNGTPEGVEALRKSLERGAKKC